ncbi:MAG: cytochrome P450 [Solirubrobacterales bacterium]|nr:cytochrome P450 [Solirubrobacterales bacterium]
MIAAMAATETPATAPSAPAANPLLGEAPPIEVGPIEPGSAQYRMPPSMELSPFRQALQFGARPLAFLTKANRQLGETITFRVPGRDTAFVLSSHPDNAKALFTTKAELVPSATAESPLRPIVGPNSILTANGARHMRQRKLLLPPFHGEAIAEYTRQIREVAEREVDTWRAGDEFPLAKRMQAVTLQVIMSGIFGIDGEPAPGTAERSLRDETRFFLSLSERPIWRVVELYHQGKMEPHGPVKAVMYRMDKSFYRVIAERREVPAAEHGNDVLSILMAATDDEGRHLSDEELRDELVSLVLAGHETTANSLAWTFERLVRFPEAYGSLRDAVRGDDRGDEWVEATIHEGMRVRPVIPLVGRRVQTDWRVGEYVVPVDTIVSSNIITMHHRPDLYPRPYDFLPQRFLGVKPGTYTWIPFGGGTRRCLGAALAMAEQRIVLETIVRRSDLTYADPEPEREIHRNVTLVPKLGGRVVVKRKLD